MRGRPGLLRSLFTVPAARRRGRAAEADGHLEEAVRHYLEAGEDEDAARLLVTLGDASADAGERLTRYTQASQLVPPAHELHREAHIKRGRAAVALAGAGPLTAGSRLLLAQVGAELAGVGAHEDAAVVFRLLGDASGEAKSLEAAGSVDELEKLLDADDGARREASARRSLVARFDDEVSQGRRREALRLADDALRSGHASEELRERHRRLLARRPAPESLALRIDGVPIVVAVGNEIIVGRGPDAVGLRDSSVSRRQLRVRRTADGVVVAEPLSAGVRLRGLGVEGPLPVGDGLELTVGSSVPLTLAPSRRVPGGVELRGGGRCVCLPLAPLPVGHGWHVVRGGDGWPELHTTDGARAFAGGTLLAPQVTLVVGDALEAMRGGPARLVVEEDRPGA